MPGLGLIDTLRSKMQHQTSGGGLLSGGLLSGLGGSSSGGGILSAATGPLQSRLATIQAAGTAQEKIKALTGTLGARLRTGGTGGLFGGLGGSSGGSSTPATDAFQVAGASRFYSTPETPAGISYR